MSKPRAARWLSLLLAALMVVGLLPMTALAAGTDDAFVSETHDVFKHTESTLAPGVEQYINYAYAKDGKQMVYYVATADITRDDVVVQTSYLKQHENGIMGMEKLTNQMAYANGKYSNPDDAQFISEYYNVVAGVNASFYNMTTGQPMGITYIDGVSFGTNSYDNFFAILKDGKTAVIDYASNLSKYVDENGQSTIWQAVAGSVWLVRDGKDVTANASGSYNTDRHSRTCVGITADGKVVTMVLDGRQEPFSRGGTMHELAQIMLEAGCVAAVNLDGGGSATYAARPEGADAVSVINRPSDGSERSISAGLIIASTAAPSNVFDRVSMTAADEYVTPGTGTEITVSGVSPAGTSAEIPEGVTYAVSNGTYENGILTPMAVGDTVLTARYEGRDVGSVTVHGVMPEKLAFVNASMTVPFGKTVTLNLTATYGLNEVKIKAQDVSFTLGNPGVGTIDGFDFTAGDGSVTESAITAAVIGTDVTAAAQIKLGKGSQVIFDFENGTTDGFDTGYAEYNYYLPKGGTFVATPENGKVRSGSYSLGINIDYSNSQESGYQMTALYRSPSGDSNVTYYPGVQSIGAWVYIPDEYVGLWIRWVLFPITEINEDGTYTVAEKSITSNAMDGGAGGTGVVYSFSESGWHYISCDLSKYKGLAWYNGYYAMQFYISDRDGASYNYYAKEHPNINGNFTVYLDDITLDYSTAVDDREAPVFSGATYATPTMSDASVLNDGASIADNTVDFAAAVADDTRKTNATGIDGSTACAYIDGNPVPCTFSNGTITIDNSVTLTAGQHTVKFSVCDKQGNYTSLIRNTTITGGEASQIRVIAHDASLDRILFGSLYYVDVVADDVANVQSVTTTLNLDSMNKWELDHMVVAKGFEVTYDYQQADKILTLTITRTGETDLQGQQALVSIPVRVWELDNVGSRIGGTDKVLEEGNKYTYSWFKNNNEYWWVAVEVRVQQGLVTLADGRTETFTGENVFCDTEAWAIQKFMVETQEGKDYKASWNGGHTHTAQPLPDKAATCTEDGYTGRTYCQVCSSVVEWGTAVPATGHSYELTDGVMKCSVCGELLTGQLDGKYYVDGVLANGWYGDSYYTDGVALTGLQKIDGYYYDFGENGVCPGRVKYTGFLRGEAGWYYVTSGSIAKGWQYIDGDYYYFDPETGLAWYGKPYYIYQQSYTFNEKGMLLNGLWVKDGIGTLYFYGPGAYKRTWAEIDGNTYYFDKDGHRKEGICWFIAGSSNNPPQWYEFTEDGVLVRIFDETGLYSHGGALYYLENGVNQKGLQLVDGDYYYFRSSDYTAVSGRYWVEHTNGLDLARGYYNFDETTHKMVVESQKNGLVEENGGLYYYVDDVLTYAGLIEIDGDYYYINSSCKAVTGRYWVFKTNGLMDAGYYDFAEDGKMIKTGPDQSKNGLVEENGGLYYYVDGVLTYAGLIEIDGDYYYINSSCKAVTGHYWVFKTNGLMDAGYYDFAEDGKMIRTGPDQSKNGLVAENGGLYYYVDGVLTYAGLIEIDGDYYYINSSCKAVTGHYWVFKTNGLMDAGYYNFAEDGKMIMP